MAELFGKDVAGQKYQLLYRVINCLDCAYPEKGSSPNLKLVSMYYSASPINK